MNRKQATERVTQLAQSMLEVVEDDGLEQGEKKARLDIYEKDLHKAQAEVRLHDQVAELQSGETDGGDAAPAGQESAGVKSIGEQFVESAQFKAVAGRGGRFSTGAVEIGSKAVGTIDEANLAGSLVTPQYLPGIVDLRFQPLVVADLFAQGSTSSNVVSYAKETVFQNEAAGVAESGAKPQSDDAFTRQTETLGKIAHFAKITDEMLQDYDQIQSFLNARLVLGVRLKEQDVLLNGTGLPTVTGVLNRSGLATTITVGGTGNPATDVDGIYHQMTQIRTTSWFEPDALVINPTDWQRIRLSVDANGQYFAGGPFTGAYGTGQSTSIDSLWGLRAVVTPAIAAGTALVGAFRMGGQVFRKGSLTVEATNSDADDFTKNLVTVRAEERLMLAVYRPGAFGEVNVTL